MVGGSTQQNVFFLMLNLLYYKTTISGSKIDGTKDIFCSLININNAMQPRESKYGRGFLIAANVKVAHCQKKY